MERFLQAAAGVLAATVLWIILSKQGKEYALILSLGACCLVLLAVFQFFQPVVELLRQLQNLGNLQPEWLSVMLKALGVGLVVEMGSLICADAGNAALGKTMQILGAVSVLWLSIPLINSLIALLQQILGGL